MAASPVRVKKIYYELPHALRAKLLAQDIPSELRKRRIWLLWKGVFQSEKNKWDKIPYYINHQPRRGQNGSDEDRAQLSDFKAALAVLKKDTTYAGLGIALLEDEEVIAVDIDGMDVDNNAAQLAEQLRKITYVETSPSGKGCRAIFTGKARSLKKPPIEIFGTSGFVTITGLNANKKKPVSYKKAPPLLSELTAAKPSKPSSQNSTSAVIPSRKLREVLEDIPNDDLPYDEWLQVIQSVHDARRGDSTGYKIALEWSQTSEKHEQKKFDTAWHSSGKRGEDAPTVTFGTLLHKAGHVQKPAEETERGPAPKARAFTFDEIARPKPIPEELWGAYVRQGIVTVVAGPGGSYKSVMLLAVAALRCSSKDHRYLDQPVKQGTTLIVLAEDRAEDCGRRLHSLARRFNVPEKSITQAIHVMELTGTDWTDLVNLKYGQAVVTETGEHIEQEAKACGADLIIIETANRITADETNPVFRKLVAELERIAIQTGAAIVLTSHVSKGSASAGNDDHHAARGGGALTDNARSVLVITNPPENSSAAINNLRVLTHAKSTHSEAVPPILLEVEKLKYCGLPQKSNEKTPKEERRELLKMSPEEKAYRLVERTLAKNGTPDASFTEIRLYITGSGLGGTQLRAALERAVTVGSLIKKEGFRDNGLKSKSKCDLYSLGKKKPRG